MPVRGTFPDATKPKTANDPKAGTASPDSQLKETKPTTPGVFSISYSDIKSPYLLGSAVDIKAPKVSNGPAASFSIDPPLSGGLHFDTDTGEITGRASALTPNVRNYLVTAFLKDSNSVTTTLAISLVVSVDPSTIPTYKSDPLTLVVRAPMAPLKLLVAAPEGATFESEPALPDGLAFDPKTGTISGSPAKSSPAADHLVTISAKGSTLSSEPINISVTTVTESGLGIDYGCARMSSGEVSCWNVDEKGRVNAQHLVGAKSVSALFAAESKGCAIQGNDKSISCWKVNGKNPNRLELPVSSAKGKVFTGALEVAIGESHRCVRTATDVACWGHNTFGQLGTKGAPSQEFPLAIASLGNGRVLHIAAAGKHTCALIADGSVECWGQSMDADAKKSDLVPTAVAGIKGATSIAVGRSHACAVVGDHDDVKCWGANNLGQLGTGSTGKSTEPKAVLNLARPAQSVTVGSDFSCALLKSGKVQCWGANEQNQLGYDATGSCEAGKESESCGLSADYVVGLPGAIDRLSSGGAGSCVLAQGNLLCWGSTFGIRPKAIDTWM
ncbi:MAG: putative Ig domain-containing protein [Deltaproteobacteria bacterium]|nr:putative Ig domain-containing protein [Deltaproteobacteria bacterium]